MTRAATAGAPRCHDATRRLKLELGPTMANQPHPRRQDQPQALPA